ncbi:MAG TPA: type II toxin-antitoxin system VapC family toxin [Ilumatobacter sp.]|nr:type II toxin-antitoxin system VapC family toxin [Ilumatobacter sp.]
MRLLLDSHVAVWILKDSARLGARARRSIADADEAFFSSATPWELSIKQNLGKSDIGIGLAVQLTSDGFKELPITAAHGEAAGALPLHHRDPFDRVIIAQARMERLIVVTSDASFGLYDVDLLDASN